VGKSPINTNKSQKGKNIHANDEKD